MAEVRLTKEQIELIKKSVEKVFGGGARMLVFGSRADLSKKGGDIDIFVIPDRELSKLDAAELRLKLLAELYRVLGERKIDIVVSVDRKREIERVALETGVEI